MTKQAGHRPGMAQFWLDWFIRVKYDVMHYCSLTYSQLDSANIEHNNGDDDMGQAEDHDIYCDHFHNY